MDERRPSATLMQYVHYRLNKKKSGELSSNLRFNSNSNK